MSLEEAHRKLLAVDPARLPPACRNVMLARPVHALSLHLYLCPFVDCTDVTESRWLAGSRGSRFVSACQRGRSGPLLGSALHAMQAFAGQVTQSIGEDVQLVELGLLPSGEIRLVEVNPALEPAEAAALLAG